MSQTSLQEQFASALRKAERIAPWSCLPVQVAKTSDFDYPLRANTMQPRVRIFSPVLEAVALYSMKNYSHCDTAFRMVQTVSVHPPETVVEGAMPDGTSFLVVASSPMKVRISVVDAAGGRTPALPFASMDNSALRLIVLAVLPHILKVDRQQGNGKLNAAVSVIGAHLDASSGGTDWEKAADIPQQVKDAAYMLDAVVTAFVSGSTASATMDFGTNDLSEPAVISADYFLNPTHLLSGTLVCENLVNGWSPLLVEAKVSHTISALRSMTIAEAKAQFASYSAVRNWTEEEQMLIPNFPDDMPVMQETLRMARRIVNTHDDVNPVCNLMWRGETGYGKSTGTRQLACILNLPFLTLTAHSRLESEELKMSFVPAGTDNSDNQGFDAMSFVSSTAPVGSHVYAAMERILKMPQKDIDEVYLNTCYFVPLIQAHPQQATELLLGTSENLPSEHLLITYMEVLHLLKSIPLQKDLFLARQNHPAQQFLHVQSPYMRAMVRGYMVEVQEVSRIKDSGVLISINEFNRPGANIQLANGNIVTRHKDALCIFTDNVGYVSSRPLEQAVIRRQSMIIDSKAEDMPKEKIFDRLRRNTKVEDEATLDYAYKLWSTVRDYCKHNDISLGSVSLCELECFVQALRDEGTEYIEELLHDCIIASATSDLDEQNEIWIACRDIIGIT